MTNGQGGHPLDRRILLGATTAALLGVPNISSAQQKSPEPVAAKGNVVIPNAVNPSRIIADFVTGFDLQHAPPLVIDRARVAFVDTVGVMLAGSQLPPADIVCDVIKSEGSAPTATIVGRPLRAAPRLAALANGVSDHAMDSISVYGPPVDCRGDSGHPSGSRNQRRYGGGNAGSLHYCGRCSVIARRAHAVRTTAPSKPK